MTLPSPTGRILHLQRLSTEDGPGIRTTVFFKGCPLRCAWCHNPESISSKMQVQWLAARCLGCGACVATCPNGCLELTDGGLLTDRARCQACGACAQACPSGAREMLGRMLTVEELLSELRKDRAYYEKSGGGVTLSGGEPALQPQFAEALLYGLKESGISTALDTCGLCSPATLDCLLPHTDVVLYDLKLLDGARHRELTGSPNRQILENLLHLREMQARRPFELWVRTPLIPGATDDTANLSAIGAFLAEEMNGCVTRWELCAFNNLCRDQYARLGMEWAYAATPLMTAEELSACERAAKGSGVDPQIVVPTGATRPADPRESTVGRDAIPPIHLERDTIPLHEASRKGARK
jgi:pyruvate formate lyase activating enzyme